MKKILLGVFALLVSACGETRTTQLVQDQIENLILAAQQSDQILKLGRIDTVQWEELVLISPYTPYESLDEKLSVSEKILSTKIDQRDDISVLVFLSANKVTEAVEFPRSVFDFSQVQGKRFTPDDTIAVGNNER